jgi:hypothetical protein
MKTTMLHILVRLGVILFVVAAILSLAVGSLAAGLLVGDFTFMALLYVVLWLIVRARIEARYVP